jgi:hypothetical protein
VIVAKPQVNLEGVDGGIGKINRLYLHASLYCSVGKGGKNYNLPPGTF